MVHNAKVSEIYDISSWAPAQNWVVTLLLEIISVDKVTKNSPLVMVIYAVLEGGNMQWLFVQRYDISNRL